MSYIHRVSYLDNGEARHMNLASSAESDDEAANERFKIADSLGDSLLSLVTEPLQDGVPGSLQEDVVR